MNLLGTMEVNKAGHLAIGGCDTVDLVAEFGTPLFVYDEALIRSTIRQFHDAFAGTGLKYQVAYASKAFCTVAMCQLVVEEGCALDVVSGGELFTALTAGVSPARIHMHGNNKTPDELEYAVQSRIGAIVVDNFAELELLNGIAERHHVTMDILLRIAPGVEAHTHDYIATGQQDSKFGFDYESGQAKRAIGLLPAYRHMRCVGVHSHIGSQIFDERGFVSSISRITDIYEQGVQLGLPFSVLNVGGGFGIRYTDEDDPAPVSTLISAISRSVKDIFSTRNLPYPDVWIEPGRRIAGPAGVTLYTAGSQKQIPDIRQYLSVDGGMTDNPRLALYGAKYEAALANRMNDGADSTWSIAGKCCETGDMLIWDAPLPYPKAGDIVVVFATGAYNYSMASHYNRIANPAVVFVRDGEASLVVERESWEDLVRFDRPLRSRQAASALR